MIKTDTTYTEYCDECRDETSVVSIHQRNGFTLFLCKRCLNACLDALERAEEELGT